MANIQTIQGLELIMVNGAPVVEEAKETNIQFIRPDQIARLTPVVEEWSKLSLSEQIRRIKAWGSQLNGVKLHPLASTTLEGKVLYHHCTYLPTIRAFTPLLQSFSGDGKCIGGFDLKLNALLTYQFTVSYFPIQEEGESEADIKKRKFAYLVSVLKLVTSEGKYAIGKVLPNGTELYHLDYGNGQIVPGACTDKGTDWAFVLGAKPKVTQADVQWIGGENGREGKATKARVTLRIPGWYVAKSAAEKFAGVMTKLMVDPMPYATKLEDLLLGSVLMYETDSETPLTEMVKRIAKGEVKPCPHPLVYSGQETSKDAPTAPMSAAAIYAMTGKLVERKVQVHTQTINYSDRQVVKDMGEVCWDSDEFVEFRNNWNEASIHSAVIVRWIPSDLLRMFFEAVGGNSETFQFIKFKGGYLVFHKTEVRIELSPLTMETSTVGENNKTAETNGSLFSELCQIIGKYGDDTIARVLYATSYEAKRIANHLLFVYKTMSVGLSAQEEEENKFGFVDVFQDRFEYPSQNPSDIFNYLIKEVGEAFWVSNPDGTSECLVSPVLATKMGTAPGAQLNLYAETVYGLAMLLSTRMDIEPEIWEREYRQWYAGHASAIAKLVRGEEVNQEVSSVLGNTTRAKFVWSSKIGSCIFDGMRKDAIHVSTNHPLAKKAGHWNLVWRNPMAFILGLQIVTVGPATDECPNPNIVTEEQILGDNKIYLHPVTWYKTAGDVDGDQCQGIDVTWLMGTWVTNPKNFKALESVGVLGKLFVAKKKEV